jgi:hypothetical protein
MRGVPKFSFLAPQEWGNQGVESECAVSAGGFLSALPTLQLDSRLRGNDPPKADRGFGGVVQIPNSLESLFGKDGLREFGARRLIRPGQRLLNKGKQRHKQGG